MLQFPSKEPVRAPEVDGAVVVLFLEENNQLWPTHGVP